MLELLLWLLMMNLVGRDDTDVSAQVGQGAVRLEHADLGRLLMHSFLLLGLQLQLLRKNRWGGGGLLLLHDCLSAGVHLDDSDLLLLLLWLLKSGDELLRDGAISVDDPHFLMLLLLRLQLLYCMLLLLLRLRCCSVLQDGFR